MTRTRTTGVTVLPEILKGLPEADQLRLKTVGRMEHHPKGSAVQKEGQIPTRQIMVNSGYAGLEIEGAVLEVMGPGAIFGSTLLTATPNVATFRALTPLVCMSFEVSVLQEVWLRNPKSLMEMLDVSIVKAQAYQTYLRWLACHTVEIKLAAVLWGISVPQKDGSRKVPACITQTILASLLGISREEVNKKKKLLATTRYLVTQGPDTYLSALTPLLMGSA